MKAPAPIPVADLQEATSFLEMFQPDGPWVITVIDPEKRTGPRTKSFGPDQQKELRAFVDKWNRERKWNIYFHVNQVSGPLTKKSARDDIVSVLSAYVDVDPETGVDLDLERARILRGLTDDLPAGVPPPSIVVDSGGGCQAYWLLKEPMIITDEDRKTDYLRVEMPSKSLEKKFSGDAVADVCRIMRLPGTINYPGADKRNRGRITRSACVISANWDLRYDLGDFPGANSANAARKEELLRVDLTALSQDIQELLKENVPEGKRNEHVYRVVNLMAECGLDAVSITKLIAAAPVGARYKNYKSALKDVKRIFSKRANAIERINKECALVIVGGKAAILREASGENGQVQVEFLTLDSFRAWYGNEFIPVDGQLKPLGSVWLASKQRRQYKGIQFKPGRQTPDYYNLWCGFTVTPKAGDCSLFKAHILNNICHGNVDHFLWFFGWWAQIVQQPDTKPGTALVVRGSEGTGKSITGEQLGSLFGPHYVVVSNTRLIVGNFNAHMLSCLVLHCEEAFWAGDKQGEGRLKDLITGMQHMIEFKGKDPIPVNNLIRLFVTGNPDWIVPASLEARRFAVFEISDEHQQDKPYFAAIAEEMKNGGREALLFELMNFDLSQVDLRTVPITDALLDQKLQSFSIEDAWWFEVLQSGSLPRGMKEPNACSSKALFEHYLDTAQKRGTSRRSIETLIGKFLRRMVPGLDGRVLTYDYYYTRDDYLSRRETGSVYFLPPLADCRRAFEHLLNQKIDWSGPGEWIDREPVARDNGATAPRPLVQIHGLPDFSSSKPGQSRTKPAKDAPVLRDRPKTRR